jgi:hypothetical protein
VTLEVFTFRVAPGLSLSLIGNDAAGDSRGAAMVLIARHFR